MTYDKIAGVLFGGAIGDALGLPAEHKTQEWCAERYPYGGPFAYERVERPGRNEIFEAGDVSDDTDQALILVDSFLEHRKVVPTDIADRLLVWAKTQKGMGAHTRKVLEHPDFATNPYKAAYSVWEVADRLQSAPNGAVMRSAVCGLFGSTLAETWQIATGMARVTHEDSRCQLSAAVVAGGVFILTRGGTYQEAHDQVVKCRLAYLRTELPFDAFEKIDGQNQGFTFVTLSAALDTLKLFASLRGQKEDDAALFAACLRRLIRRGGDTDTNAAVAGALMGAMVGLNGLPMHLLATLRHPYALERRAMAIHRIHGGHLLASHPAMADR